MSILFKNFLKQYKPLTDHQWVCKTTMALSDHIYGHSENTWTSQYWKDVLVLPLSPNPETTGGCSPLMMVITPI